MPQVHHRGGQTILVVEDEDALREVTKRILTRSGYQVLTAGSGPEALKVADGSRNDIDLLLTDVIMPYMHGQELAEQLTARRPGLRVIYMSGYAQPFITGEGTLDPDTVLITKPFTQQELLAHIGEVLKQGRTAVPRPDRSALRRLGQDA